MAQFVAWWDSNVLTNIEDAARNANILVSAGTYRMGSLDLGDSGDWLAVTTPGVVVSALDTTWLVFPRPAPEQSWAAQRVAYSPDSVTPTQDDPLILAGPGETSGDSILAKLLGREPADMAAVRLVHLQDAVRRLRQVSDEMRMSGDPRARQVTDLANEAGRLTAELTANASGVPAPDPDE